MPINKVVYSGKTLLDLSGDTVTASKMLSGIKAHDKAGNAINGTIKENGELNLSMDGIRNKYVTIPAGYTTGGIVTLDSTIDNALLQIINALKSKGITVPQNCDITDIAALIGKIEVCDGDIDGGMPDTINAKDLDCGIP